MLVSSGMNQQEHTFVGAYGVRKTGPNNQDRYVMGVRHYDATVGRFLQEDPIGLQGGDINLMRYTRNNPLKYIDPKGLSCGSGWNECLVPDSPWGYVFSGACEDHDKCYGTCGMQKHVCDANFYADMAAICRGIYAGDANCLFYAHLYFRAVHLYGSSAYRSAQKNCMCNK
jgi:RHS repeat-associated protein